MLWLLASGASARAQSLSETPEEAELRTQQRRLMLTLGAGGVVSAMVGGVGLALDEGRFRRNLWGQQLAWGTINAGIAAIGWVGAARQRDQSVAETRRRYRRVYLINAGLDVLYVVSGVLLWHFAERDDLRGVGAGIVPQGSFLLTFDIAAAWRITE